MNKPNIVKTSTISVAHDSDTTHETTTITFTCTWSRYSSSSSKNVNIRDDDVTGTIEITSGTLSIDEGDSGTFSVSLSTEPYADVTVSLSKNNNDVTISPTSLTFTPSNWSTAQTVTVSAGEDDDKTEDSASITLSASGGITAANVTKQVSIIDNDEPGFDLTKTSLSLTEGGSSVTFGVRPATRPSANITVTVTAPADLAIDTDPNTAGNQNTLAFARWGQTNAWNQYRTVTVTANHDDDGGDETPSITLTGAGGDYEGVTATVTTALDDDDDVVFLLTETSLSLTEGGSDTFGVRPATRPSANITVTVSAPASADLIIDTDPNTDGNQNTLTFARFGQTNAWNQYKTVSVAALHDLDANDESGNISLTGEGGDYDDVTGSVAFTVTDLSSGITPAHECVSVSVSVKNTTLTNLCPYDISRYIAVTDGGTCKDASSIPISVTTRRITSTLDIGQSNTYGVDLLPMALCFSYVQYVVGVSDSQTLQRQRSTGYDECPLHTTCGSSGVTLFNPPRLNSSKPSGTIQVTPAGTLSIDEGDSTGASLQVSLSAAPNANVTVSLSKTNADVTLSPTSLTFTASNWSTAQTVTVSAGHDDDAEDDTDTITLSATGGINAQDATKAVSVSDDDIAGNIVLDPAGTLIVDEGASQTFTVALSARPNADVTVTLSKPDDAAIAFDRDSLTFTTSDWNVGQTVIVSAVHDEDADNESPVITLTATGGINAPEVKVDVLVEDDDLVGGLSLSPVGTLEVVEGGSAVFGVALSGEPTVAGVVEVLLSNTDPNLTLSPATLAFTDENWNRAQSVTLNALDDEDVVDGSDVITLTITGGGNYALAPDVSVPVRILDTPGVFALAPTTLSLVEGGEAAPLEARLETRPVGTPTVVVTFTADRSGIEMTPSILVFPADGWDTPQGVSVRAVDDSNTLDERVTITAVAVGGNYRSVRRMATASVKDDDDESVPLPPIRTRALAFPPASAQDNATMRVRCRQDSPCDVVLDCRAQADGSAFEASLPEPVPAWGTVTLTAADIEGHTGASWAGKGRLGCALRSEGNLSAQVWTRSGDGVLVNNSAFIRSAPEGDGHRADIESIPEPESAEKSNFRIRCEALQDEDCTATRFSCYDDAGVRYDGDLGTIERWRVRHLQTASLVDIIDHRWQGMGLSCELRSNAPFTVQVLTRTGGGGALVNNSATGER